MKTKLFVTVFDDVVIVKKAARNVFIYINSNEKG